MWWWGLPTTTGSPTNKEAALEHNLWPSLRDALRSTCYKKCHKTDSEHCYCIQTSSDVISVIPRRSAAIPECDNWEEMGTMELRWCRIGRHNEIPTTRSSGTPHHMVPLANVCCLSQLLRWMESDSKKCPCLYLYGRLFGTGRPGEIRPFECIRKGADSTC